MKTADTEKQVNDIRELMDIKTDSKAVQRLMQWGHKGVFGRK